VARRHPKTSSRERRGISRPWCPRRPWAWYRSNQTRRAATRRHLRVFHQPRSSRPSRSTARTRVPGHVRALAVEKLFAKPEAHLSRRRYARSSRARRPVAARGGRFGARRSSTGPRRRCAKPEAVGERRRCASPSPAACRGCPRGQGRSAATRSCGGRATAIVWSRKRRRLRARVLRRQPSRRALQRSRGVPMVLRPLPTRAVRRGAAHGFGCGGRYRKSASAFTSQKMRLST
jgi:hypothetical protein